MTTSNLTTAMISAFSRLKWSIFEEPSTLRVAPIGEGSVAELEPVFGHPVAAEAASDVPLHETDFTIMVLSENEGQGWEASTPMAVRGKHDSIVTIGDAVEQLSPHFFAHRRVYDDGRLSVTTVDISPWPVHLQ
jgi:hypothetical protein